MGVACQLASWPKKAAESRFFFYSGVEQNHTMCFPAEAVGPWKICRPYLQLIVCSHMGYFYIHTNPQGAEGQETRSLEIVWFCCWLASFLPKLWVQTGGRGKNGNAKVKKKGVASERTRKSSGVRCLLTQTGRAHKPRLAPSLASLYCFHKVEGVDELRS